MSTNRQDSAPRPYGGRFASGQQAGNNGGLRRNQQIRAEQVRLIGVNSEQLGVCSLAKAMEYLQEMRNDVEQGISLAAGLELDLVELDPTASPPVVKVMDYKKYLFQQNKRKALAKKKQKQIKLKEVKFRPTTDINDYGVKLRNLRSFIENGDKVKVSIWFKGREITHQEIGFRLLERIKADVADYAKVDAFPSKVEGRNLIMVLSPAKLAK